MKGVIKIFGFVINVLLISSITGCADFPDEYAIETTIEINAKDAIELSEDGRNFKSAALVHFDIEKNTCGKISKAIVTVQGVDYDVTNQLNPSVGGIVEIPYSASYNSSVSVVATLDILGHKYTAKENIRNDLSNLAKVTTGTATNITPYSAVLNADISYPWLVNTTTSYWMVVSPGKLNVSLGEDFTTIAESVKKQGNMSLEEAIAYVLSSLPNFKFSDHDNPVSVFRCNYSQSKMHCIVNDLTQDTKYNYQLIQLGKVDDGVEVVYASDVKSFNTVISTASLNVTCNDLYYNYLTFSTSLDKGNTKECVMSSGVAKVMFYFGESESQIQHKESLDAYNMDSFVFNLYNLKENTKYYYKIEYWIGNQILALTGIQSVTTLKAGEAKENGHEWVSLGLPSGLKWATMNVGASSELGSGDYYAWGETTPKQVYDYSTYKWCNGTNTSIFKYKPGKGQEVTLELEDDAAHINWGGQWRIPTWDEWKELATYCTWKIETKQGMSGYTIKSKSNGNSIFLPEAGYYSGNRLYQTDRRYYWTSTCSNFGNGYDSAISYDWWSDSNSVVTHKRCDGLTIRAVCP